MTMIADFISTINKLLLINFIYLCVAVSIITQNQFSTNCLDKEMLCSSEKVDCDSEIIFGKHTSNTSLLPNEPHDLRIESFSKAQHFRNSSSEHQLNIEISWQTPPNNSTRFLHGFLLEIDKRNGSTHECFFFNLTDRSNWTAETIAKFPRLRFSTHSLFKYSQQYEITVFSLPRSMDKSNSVHRIFDSPNNPNLLDPNEFVYPNCTRFSHPYASKWTAGFRHIYIHSLARKLQVEFVGAPPQYCFEQYEVRLLDESASELLYSALVNADEMRKEITPNNVTISYGMHNFTDLEYDRLYIPSVIPVERASDGRCLCPVHGNNPYDIKVICSCVAADWKTVRINSKNSNKSSNQKCLLEIGLNVVQGIEENSTFSPFSNVGIHNTQHQDNPFPIWIPFFVLNLTFCFGVCGFLLWYHGFCKKLKIPNEKDNVYTRIVLSTNEAKRLECENSVKNGRLNNQSPSVTAPTSPLLLNPRMNILILYSHDSTAHEEAVTALAEYLRDVFNLQISMDCWDTAKIETNLVDYIASSVLEANKILIINSVGARTRYYSKIFRTQYSVKRKDSGPYDKIFLQQVDMVLQHPSIISARFSYTSSEDTLPQLVDSLNYILPDHVPSLMSALFGKNMKHDSRVASGYSPHLVKLQIKVKQMLDICQAKPHWFIDSHYKQTFQDELQKEYRISSSATQLSTRNCNPSDSSQDFESVEEAEMPVIERNEIVEFSNGRSSSSLQTDFDETTTGDSGIEASIPLCSTTCELNSEIDNQDVQSEETLENQDIIKTKESPGRSVPDSGIFEWAGEENEQMISSRPKKLELNGTATEKLFPKMGSAVKNETRRTPVSNERLYGTKKRKMNDYAVAGNDRIESAPFVPEKFSGSGN